MKRVLPIVLTIVLALAIMFTLSACNEKTEAPQTENAAENESSDGVMSYAAYMEAPLESEVVVDTYVQAKQEWWENKATLYTQNEDGAIFVYNSACSHEDYDKLVEGQKIRVSGIKSEWSGEIEIVNGEIEILEGTYIAEPTDITHLLGQDAIIEHQNEKVSFSEMTIEPSNDGEKDVPFLFNWDGSGQKGDDIYFNASKNGSTYTFTIESYLTDEDSEVYNAAQELNIGDTVDLEGFLYWYEGVNPHITAIK